MHPTRLPIAPRPPETVAGISGAAALRWLDHSRGFSAWLPFEDGFAYVRLARFQPHADKVNPHIRKPAPERLLMLANLRRSGRGYNYKVLPVHQRPPKSGFLERLMEALEAQAANHDAPLFVELVRTPFLADWLERRGYRMTAPGSRNWVKDCRTRHAQVRGPQNKAHARAYWATAAADEVLHHSLDSLMKHVLDACIPDVPPAFLSVAEYREEAGDPATGATHARLLPDTARHIDVDAWIRRHFPDRPRADRTRSLLGTVHEIEDGALDVWHQNTPTDARRRIEPPSDHMGPIRRSESEIYAEIRPVAYVYDDCNKAKLAAPDTMGSTARTLLLPPGSARELFELEHPTV